MARILLAEDDDQMRAFLGRGLRRAGQAVDAVGDGDRATARPRNADCDLLLAGAAVAQGGPVAVTDAWACATPGQAENGAACLTTEKETGSFMPMPADR